MVNRLLSALVLLLVSLPVRADYEPTLLPELAGDATLIVEARIIAVGANTFTLKPVQIFKGKASSTIVVDRFRDWTCASRFAPYAVNQQAFYFLKKNKSNHFYTLGAANEGEIPLYKSAIYYQNAYLKIDKTPQLFRVYTGKVRGYQYTRHHFVAAIKLLISQLKIGSYLKTSARNIIDTTTNPVMHRLADEYIETHSTYFN